MSQGINDFDAALTAEGVTGNLALLARSIYTQESGSGKNTKTSNAGARGGMQILPATFAGVADKGWSIDDPVQNARAGIRYLKQLDKQSGGDPALTAAGYYGGPGGLEKARQGVAVSDPRNPGAPNTLQYGQQVAARLGKEAPRPVQQVAALAPAVVEPVPASTQVAEAVKSVQTPQGPDPWQQFLNTMPQGQQVAMGSMDYGPGYSVSAPQTQVRSSVNNRAPNFAAFSSWRGRVT